MVVLLFIQCEFLVVRKFIFFLLSFFNSKQGRVNHMKEMLTNVEVKDIIIAHQILKDVVVKTPLMRDDILSERYQCNVFLKREDLQIVRSFKIRGAYHLMQSLSPEQVVNGV